MFEGHEVLEIARRHLGERYVLGARAELNNPNYKGPWDCAEFCTWVVFQAYKITFGTTVYGDPFSGAWIEDAHEHDTVISVEDAVRRPGAILLRRSVHTGTGHVAFSDGKGGTVEARGSKYGVVEAGVYEPGRKWDFGCTIPGVLYEALAEAPTPPPAPTYLTMTDPFTRGSYVEDLQRALRKRSFHPGKVDGIFGPATAGAVANFQRYKQLLPDAIVGPATANALGLEWPPKPGSLSS